MNKIKCMLDKKEYGNKPQGFEIAKITNRLEHSQVEIEIEELASKLIKGCTFKPSLLNGKKEENWMEEQLFALDFDDGITITETLNKCEELNILPCIGYTSFSHTTENNRFRLIFCTNEPITNYDVAKQLQLTLMNIFKECDGQCKNLSRLYYGGRNLIYNQYNNRINYIGIIEKYPIEKETNDIKGGEKSPHNNIKVLSNSNIIVGTKTPKTDIENFDDNYNIKAIRNRDVEYLKNKINHPHMVFQNNQEFCDYIFKEIDLGELLEFKYPKSIRCLFHEDNNPSASIFQNEDGYWIYHCFSCGVSYNLLGVIEVLGNFKSRPKAYKFIREIFNLEISESEWQREQKEILLENLKVLTNGELEEKCPTTYKNIKSNIKYLQQLLLIAMDNVYNEKLTDDDENVLFYASTRYICRSMNINEGNAKEISKKNVLFQYHNLLNKVDDIEANEDILKRSQAISINSDDKNKKYRHVNYYSFPSYNNLLFKDIENKGINWNDNNYTIKGLSREMFYRTEGLEVANKLYPQYKGVYDKVQKQIVDRTTTNISNVRTDLIVIIIFDILKVKPYITDKEIIDELSSSGEVKTSKAESEKQLKKSIQEILDTYNLKRIRCNKKIKEQYNVDINGYPFIIVKNEE